MSYNLVAGYSSDEDIADTPTTLSTNPVPKQENIEEIVTKLLKNVVKKIVKRYEYRTFSSSESEDSDDDGDESMWSYGDADSDGDVDFVREKRCYTVGELGLNDLPEIENLHVTVPVQKLSQIGIVQSILDCLVVVSAFKNTTPLDIDSVLFSKTGAALGKIFDVIGQVSQPLYVLRFNSAADVTDLGIFQAMPIYYVENEMPLTKYVFVRDLIKQKGCDASWKHNNEAPEEEIDFSDDEKERSKKKKNRKRTKENIYRAPTNTGI